MHVIEKGTDAAPPSSPVADAAATEAGPDAGADADVPPNVSDRLFLASYHNGEIVNFEQATDDPADLAVLNLCGKVR